MLWTFSIFTWTFSTVLCSAKNDLVKCCLTTCECESGASGHWFALKNRTFCRRSDIWTIEHFHLGVSMTHVYSNQLKKTVFCWVDLLIPLTGSDFKLQFQASRRTCWLSLHWATATATNTTASTSELGLRQQQHYIHNPSDRISFFFLFAGHTPRNSDFWTTATRPQHTHTRRVCVCETKRERECSLGITFRFPIGNRASETW